MRAPWAAGYRLPCCRLRHTLRTLCRNSPLRALLPTGDARAATALLVNGALYVVGRRYATRSLTPEALVHAAALGMLLWASLGWAAWTTCVLFLVLGSVATRVKLAEKESRGIAEKRGGARGPENVWGSAAVAAVCCILYSLWVYAGVATGSPVMLWCKLGFVASMATKLSDTLATEIGKAYGRTTYLVTNFQRVAPGTEGAISAEGTVAGIVGSLVIAGFGAMSGLIPATRASVVVCAVAALVATTIESVIGATVQQRHAWLTNETVNVMNTALGALFAVLLAGLCRV